MQSKTRGLLRRSIVQGPAPALGDFGTVNGLGMAAGFLVPLVSDDVRMREEIYAAPEGRPVRLCLLEADAEHDKANPRPGVIFVHGGGWAGGSPAYHMRQGHDLATRGYVGAAIQYRLTPSVSWPAPLDDVRAAVRWMRSRSTELGVDPDHIAVVGGSAGGHLAAMATLVEADDVGGVSSAVQAAVLLYTPTDLRDLDRALPQAPPALAALLPRYTNEVLREVSPVTHVHAAAPPILSMIGDRDQAIDVATIDAFHDELSNFGVSSDLVVWEGREHGFDFHPADYAPSFAMIAEFLGRALGTDSGRVSVDPTDSPALRDPSLSASRRPPASRR